MLVRVLEMQVSVCRPQQIAKANVVWMLFMRTTLDQRCLRR
jgi:hypothetical protein